MGLLMKVLVISGSNIPIPPVLYGGIERQVFNLCKGLSLNDYVINLLAVEKSSNFNGKINFYRKYRYGTSFLGRAINWAEFQFQTLRLLNDVDIIHSFLEWPELHFFLNKVKRPIVYAHQNPLKTNSLKRILKANPSHGYMQCVSNNHISKVEVTDPKKAFVTYNCVDTDFFKRQKNVKKENFLLYLGRLNYEKGIDVAVRLSQETGVPLKIAGPVRLEEKFSLKLFKERVEPFLSEHIKYLGSVNDLDKRILLSKAKALIVPNRWEEPFGLMNAEALACGTPIIATNKGSLKEIILNGKTGFLCDNYGELSEAIRNVDYLSRKFCRADAIKRFSLKTYINQTEKIYKKILGDF